MSGITITTFDWVPEIPRGYVRDLRIRWALEEAGLNYTVTGTSFHHRTEEHFTHQPFGQVPWLTDGGTTMFESGAILLYLAERSTTLMPTDATARNKTIEWLFAALNSVEMAALPWSIFKFSDDQEITPGRQHLDNFLKARLQNMEQQLTAKTWLTDSFTVADIAMADVLRLVNRFDGLEGYPACREYVVKATGRMAFKKAYADQMTFFAGKTKSE